MGAAAVQAAVARDSEASSPAVGARRCELHGDAPARRQGETAASRQWLSALVRPGRATDTGPNHRAHETARQPTTGHAADHGCSSRRHPGTAPNLTSPGAGSTGSGHREARDLRALHRYCRDFHGRQQPDTGPTHDVAGTVEDCDSVVTTRPIRWLVVSHTGLAAKRACALPPYRVRLPHQACQRASAAYANNGCRARHAHAICRQHCILLRTRRDWLCYLCRCLGKLDTLSLEWFRQDPVIASEALQIPIRRRLHWRSDHPGGALIFSVWRSSDSGPVWAWLEYLEPVQCRFGNGVHS